MLARTDRGRDVALGPAELLAQLRQHATRAGDRREAQPLRQAGRRTGSAQATGMSDHLPQREAARPALRRGAPQVLDIRAACFDDPAVRHPRWAHALAGPAPEAEVDMSDLLFVEGHRPTLPLRHQVDAAARRLGLQPGDAKRRTRIQAEPAVDAGREIVVRKPGKRRAQTTNLPGFEDAIRIECLLEAAHQAERRWRRAPSSNFTHEGLGCGQHHERAAGRFGPGACLPDRRRVRRDRPVRDSDTRRSPPARAPG